MSASRFAVEYRERLTLPGHFCQLRLPSALWKAIDAEIDRGPNQALCAASSTQSRSEVTEQIIRQHFAANS